MVRSDLLFTTFPEPIVAIATPLLIAPVLAEAPWQDLSQLTGKDANGEIVFKAVPVAERFRNPWPVESEREFQQRARGSIAAQMQVKANAGNTYFENEKRSYGYLMAHVIGGRGMAAVKDLQIEDAQHDEWHSATNGIDYYACFTLKHQMRTGHQSDSTPEYLVTQYFGHSFQMGSLTGGTSVDLTATGNGTTYCGVAVEVGEQESHGSFAAFQQAVLKARVDETKLAEGVVQYRAATGNWLGLHWHDNPLELGVWRNGKRRDLAADARFFYRAGEDATTVAPLHAKWGDGKMVLSITVT